MVLFHNSERRVMFRRAMRNVLFKNSMKAGAQGIKVELSGRLAALRLLAQSGIVKVVYLLHTLRADIDYLKCTRRNHLRYHWCKV